MNSEIIKSYIKQNNIIPKLLSIVMATILWFYVQNNNAKASSIYTSLDKIPVAKKLILRKPWNPISVRIHFKGYEEQLSFDRNSWKVSAYSVTTQKPGINRFYLRSNKNPPRGIELEIIPSFIDVLLSRKVEKRLKVKVRLAETFKENFVLHKIKINPEFVLIAAPIEQIRDLRYIYTKEVDFDGNIGSIEQPISLNKDAKNILFLGKDKGIVNLKASVLDKKNYTIEEFENIAIEVHALNPKIKVKIIPEYLLLRFLIPKGIVLNDSKLKGLKAYINCSKFYLQEKKILPYDTEKNYPVELNIPRELEQGILFEKNPDSVAIILRFDEGI